MPQSVSPHIKQNSNLVLAIDTSDYKNSYVSKPTTNITSGISNSQGENSGTYYKTHNYTTTETIPRLGKATVYNIDNYNDYSGGSGVCCENIFSYGTGLGVSGNTLYTYSIIYRSATGYTHPNLMYRYEYGASGYITEGGVFNSGQQTYLGNGWYWAWGQFTTNASTTYINTYCFIYEYATYNTISIAAAMIVQGNYIIPPEQFLPPSTTKSATTGLLDITGANTINLSNNTFNSDGSIYYDGSTYTNVGNLGNVSDFTVEVIFRSDSVTSYRNVLDCNWLVYNGGASGYSNIGPRLEQNSSGNLGWVVGDSSGNYTGITVVSSGLNGSNYHHVVLTKTGINFSSYYNGTNVTNTTFSYWTSNMAALNIGRGFSTSRYFVGVVPVLRIYNRPLTSLEVSQNYNQFKKRFNLP